jgi:hypothetical protein
MAFSDPLLGNKTPDIVNKEGSGFWDGLWNDATDFIGGAWDDIKDAASESFDNWLDDEFGTKSDPERAIESPQAKNADPASAPPVAFGLSQNQILLAGAAVVAAIILIKVAK